MSTTVMQATGARLVTTAGALFIPRTPHRISARPPTPAQRAYLKAMRRAELEAWRSQGGQIEAGAEPFRRVKTEIARQRASERWLFVLLAALAGAALVIAFDEPIRLADDGASLARFLQQLFGF